MNLTECYDFFDAIAIDMILDKDRYVYLKTAGVSPVDWPPCRARDVMMQFERRMQEKSYEYASSVIYNQYYSSVLPIELPSTTNELIAEYQERRTFTLVTDLADRLKRDPMHGLEAIASFRAGSDAGVKIINFSDSIPETIADLEKRRAEGTLLIEIPRWPILSQMIDGWQPERVYILTARSGVGKTAFALNLAIDALDNMSVLYFNMEMSVHDINRRCLAIATGIRSEDFTSGSYVHQSDRIVDFQERVRSGHKLLFSTGESLTLEQICQQTIWRKEEQNVGLVVVDYDQKIMMKGQQEEWQMLLRAVSELEAIAKAAQVPILLLSQAGDDGSPRASRRITQVASTLMNLDCVEGQYLLHIKKNRHAQDDQKIRLNFDRPRQRMSEAGLYVDKPKTQNAFTKLQNHAAKNR